MQESVVIDKSLLIADVLNSSAAVTLFCRPRRFGKSLNMTMLKSFFEIPPASDPNAEDAAYLFEGLSIWDADDGRYREPSGRLSRYLHQLQSGEETVLGRCLGRPEPS